MKPDGYEIIETLQEKSDFRPRILRVEIPGKESPEKKEQTLFLFPLSQSQKICLLKRHLSSFKEFSHPRLLPLIEGGQITGGEQEAFYLVASPMAGEPFMEAAAKLGSPEKWDLLFQLISLLEYLHSRGYLMGNLSPFSFRLLSGSEGPQVQFTHLYNLVPENTSLYEVDSSLTDYYPPERLWGLPLDRRSDVYSLGALLYSLWTGVKPSFASLLDEEAPSLEDSSLPPELVPVLQKCLHPSPQERYSSLGELAEGLKALPSLEGPFKDRTFFSSPALPWTFSPKGREILGEFEKRYSQIGEGESLHLWIQGKGGSGKSSLLDKMEAHVHSLGGGVLRGRGVIGRWAPLSTLRELSLSSFSIPQPEPWEDGVAFAGQIWEQIHTHLIERDTPSLVLIVDDLEWADELTLKVLEYLLSLKETKGALLIVGAFESSGRSLLFKSWWERMEKRQKTETFSLGDSGEGRPLPEISSSALPILVALKAYPEGGTVNFLSRWLSLSEDNLYESLYPLLEQRLVAFRNSEIEITNRGLKVEESLSSDILRKELLNSLRTQEGVSPFGFSDRASLVKALDLCYRWGCFGKAFSYSEKVVKEVSPEDPEYIEVLSRYITLLERKRNYWQIIDTLSKVDDRGSLSPEGEWWFSYQLGKSYLNQRKVHLAEEPLKKALGTVECQPSGFRVALILLLSLLNFEKGQGEKALEMLQEAQEKISSPKEKFPLKIQYGDFKINQCKYPEALESLKSLYETTPEEAVRERALLEFNLSRIALEQGEYREAEDKLNRAIGTFRKEGTLPDLISALTLKASLFAAKYFYEEALPFAQEAFHLALCLEDPKYLWGSQTVLGKVEYERGEKKDGTTHLLRALFLANLSLDAGALCELLIILGKIHLDRKDVGRSEVLMRKARELSREKNLPHLTARVDYLSSLVARLLGDEQIETALRERALKTFYNLGNRKEFCEVLLEKLAQQKQKGLQTQSGFVEKLKDALEGLGIPRLLKAYEELQRE